ncbi:PREDICTED: hemK methyltransferase family member 1-like, partial [Dipodomys ordii]|uniref:HemK methyltransferase family member 1-like n=1 Tax=Dipodomys ordii TaxID=10020 RepID=A0A1S3GVR6_DIPOR
MSPAETKDKEAILCNRLHCDVTITEDGDVPQTKSDMALRVLLENEIHRGKLLPQEWRASCSCPLADPAAQCQTELEPQDLSPMNCHHRMRGDGKWDTWASEKKICFIHDLPDEVDFQSPADSRCPPGVAAYSFSQQFTVTTIVEDVLGSRDYDLAIRSLPAVSRDNSEHLHWNLGVSETWDASRILSLQHENWGPDIVAHPVCPREWGGGPLTLSFTSLQPCSNLSGEWSATELVSGWTEIFEKIGIPEVLESSEDIMAHVLGTKTVKELVEWVLEEVVQHPHVAGTHSDPLILEVGCDSGAVLLSLLNQLHDSQVIAVDKDEASIRLTQNNAQRLRLPDRIWIIPLDVTLEGSWILLLPWAPLDPVTSNPPNVFHQDMEQLAPEIL